MTTADRAAVRHAVQIYAVFAPRTSPWKQTARQDRRQAIREIRSYARKFGSIGAAAMQVVDDVVMEE